MSFWSQTLAEAARGLTGYVFALLVLCTLLAHDRPALRKRFLRGMWTFFLLHASLLPLVAALALAGSSLTRDLRLAAQVCSAICVVQMATFLVFVVVLPQLGVQASRILKDVVTGTGSLLALFYLAAHAGLDVSGLVATSAVITAVVGFALKDTLGNVIGGLSLQTDRSIQIGDWIRVGDVSGRVVEIRWRYTAVETRNWETLIVPNSVLTTEKVMVLGRRVGEPLQWRRWVYFNVDFRFAPADVTRIALEALADAPVPRMAAHPAPACMLLDVQQSYCRYAVLYFLTDLAVDEPTDTVVRTRVFYALKRAGIPLSIPAHAVFMTEESRERTEHKQLRERGRRLGALSRVEILRPLTDADRERLAEALHYAPFGPGEQLTRQGAEGHWLYLIVEGEVAVRVAEPSGLEREVARLCAGDFFGEMSLMTGERRSATVVAVGAVECYRLDKEAFQQIIRDRPEIAEPVAEILAKRRGGLTAAREGLDQEARGRRVAADKHDLLARIRNFFSLD